MIWTANARGEIVFVCSDWEQITGEPRERALGRGWAERVHPDDRDEVLRAFDEALKQRLPYALAYRLKQATGDYGLFVEGANPSFGPPEHTFLGFFGSTVLVGRKQAPGVSSGLTAYSSSSLPALSQLSTLELIADHLLVAHALASEEAGRTARAYIEEALTNIRRELIAAANKMHKGGFN